MAIDYPKKSVGRFSLENSTLEELQESITKARDPFDFLGDVLAEFFQCANSTAYSIRLKKEYAAKIRGLLDFTETVELVDKDKLNRHNRNYRDIVKEYCLQ